MIIKLIDAKERTAGTDQYAVRLADYMATARRDGLRPDAVGADYGLTLAAYMGGPRPAPEEGRERVLYRGALVSGAEVTWDDGFTDMNDRLSRRSAKVKKPARHVVLSYRAGEQPDEVDCRQAVSILAKELGCEQAAVLWAAHADTDNIHIHALFLTVDRQTGAALPFGQGAGGRAAHKEAMQRAIARIEHAQALQAEQGARYEVENGHVVRKSTTHSPTATNKRTPLRQEILDFEARSGIASFTRMAQELAAPAIEGASVWREVHMRLAAVGMGIRSVGNGGELYAGDDHVKLSSVDRKLSWKQLIKPDRLGPFEDAPDGHAFSPAAPRILDPVKARAWLGRADEEQAIKRKLDRRIAHLLAQRDAALAELTSTLAMRRGDLSGMEADPRLLRDLDGAWPRLRDSARDRTLQAFAKRIDAIRGMKQALAIELFLADIDLDSIGELDAGYVAPWHGRDISPLPQELEGYRGERRGNAICYWANSNPERRRPAIVDAGAIIWVNDRSDASVAASLRLAQARFGSVAVFGDRAYLDQCRRLAAELGIEVEETTRRQALRRARTSGKERTERRRSALERQDLQRWASRFHRAEPLRTQVPSDEGVGDFGAVQEIGTVHGLPTVSPPVAPLRTEIPAATLHRPGQIARGVHDTRERVTGDVSPSSDRAQVTGLPPENAALSGQANNRPPQRAHPRGKPELGRDR